MSDRYAAIQAERAHFPVRLMCRALGVSVSGFYDAQARQRQGPTTRECADVQVRLQVRTAFATARQRYGAPRVHRELRAAGLRVAKRRVARLMQEEGLVARARRRFVRTTDSDHVDPIAPNRLARVFAVEAQVALDRVWVSDMTYIPTNQGWLYLAVVLDLASRRVVGWAMGESLATTLPLAALQTALADRRPAAGLIHHSDRGSQYASGAYRAALDAAQAQASMSRRGDCYDNAVAESFFATLEHELLAHQGWAGHPQARQAIFEFIEVWYNRVRRHSSLGYVSPVQFEQDRLAHSAQAA